MRDYGVFFRRERKRRGMSQLVLASGICSVDTISRIENGGQIPSPVLFTLLIERLGVSGFSYGDFFGSETIGLLKLQRRIIEALDRRLHDPLPGMLDEFRRTMEQGGWDEQFYIFARGWYDFEMGRDPGDYLDSCRIAMRILHPDYHLREDVTEWNLIQNEYRILNAIALSYYKRRSSRSGLALLNQLIANQRSEGDGLPVYWQNLAVLYNNAALFEREKYPLEAQEHMQYARRAVIRSESLLTFLRVEKTRLLYFAEGEDLKEWMCWMRDYYFMLNAGRRNYEDFWEFLNENCWMNIL